MKSKSLRDIRSVLVVCTDNIIVLSVIRVLGQIIPHAEINTISPPGTGNPVWSSSRFTGKCHFFHESEKRDKLHELIECIQVTKADIVLPAGEDQVRFLAEFQDVIRQYTLLAPLPTPGLFDQLVPKNRLNDFLMAKGLPHSKNYRLDDPVLDDRDIYSFPLLLKPVRGSFGSGIRKIDNYYHLQQAKNLNPENYFLQEIIQGEIFECNLLAIEGTIKACSIQKNIITNDFSYSPILEFIHQQEIYESSRRLIEYSGYNGLANLDFCVDEKDSNAKLIDFNPLFWVTIQGSKAAGIDFVKLYCLAALGQLINKQDYRECTFMMGRIGLKYLGRRCLKPFSNGYPKQTHTDAWVRISDPKPEIVRYIKRKLSDRSI